MDTFHANGKLLLSAEYAIMHGAVGLAIPLKYGQKLMVKNAPKIAQKAKIFWKAIDKHNDVWFSCTLQIKGLALIEFTNQQKAETIKVLFQHCSKSYFDENRDYYFETVLEFDVAWGWGTSSTLVSLIAQAFKANPYELYKTTFKGSGYDLACATANQPILYHLINGNAVIHNVDFNPSFKKNIYFVYLGQKQNSLGAIQNLPVPTASFIAEINSFTEQMLVLQNNEKQFCDVLEKHEITMSQYLGQPTVKQRLFKDLDLTFKSLGAWGGDFVMVVGAVNEIEKIKRLGYATLFSWDEIVL